MRVIRAPERMGGGPYTVQFAPDAWTQVGALPWDVFEELQKTLGQFAELNGTLVRPEPGRQNTVTNRAAFELKLSRYRCIADVDAEARRITLLAIERK